MSKSDLSVLTLDYWICQICCMKSFVTSIKISTIFSFFSNGSEFFFKLSELVAYEVTFHPYVKGLKKPRNQFPVNVIKKKENSTSRF